MQKVLMRIAARNVIRHWRRSLIAGCSIGFGLAALIFLDALFSGMRLSMIEIATGSLVGHAEIVRTGYDKNQDVTVTIQRPEELMRRLADDPRVEAFTPRLSGSGVMAGAGGSASVSLMGIDPVRELAFSNLGRWVHTGVPSKASGEIVVGEALARQLHLGLGDRVVIGSGRADNGELSQEAYHVVGLMKSGLDSLDEHAVIMVLPDAQKLLALPDQVHKVSVKFRSEARVWDRLDPWWSDYGRDALTALSWRDILPQLEGAFAFLNQATFLIVAALVCVACLSILNVLFMSLYERMPEFGVLRAVGTTPAQLGSLIVWESIVLATLSAVIGMLLGLLLTLAGQRLGIPYQGVEFAGMNLAERLRPALHLLPYFSYSAIVLLCCAVAAFIPARTAMRILPIQAIRNHGN
jgi:ABC-type lipoprotein release transport system permease subunit